MFGYFSFLLWVLMVSAAPKSLNQKSTIATNADGRIINGQPASLGQFPWQAALYVTGTESGAWFCGGSIISEEWILTAGHCADGAMSARVLTGLIDLNENSTVSTSSEFIVHKDYNPSNLQDDIALLKLDEPLTFDDYTHAITLSSDLLEDGVKITVSGWGKTSDNSGVSEFLNYVDLLTITTSQCEDTYGEGEIFEGMVCAISDSDAIRSTCNGDSGGPVIINADTDPVHVAIVSFVSDRGCETGEPSGYTRTAYYRDWIQQHTEI